MRARKSTLMAALRAVIMVCARRAGSGGFRCADIQGWTPQRVNDQCRLLVRDGDLHQATTGHRTVRYFTDQSHRDVYMAEHQTASRLAASKLSVPGSWHRAPWGPQDPAIETAATIYTVCPSFAWRNDGNPPRTNTYSPI